MLNAQRIADLHDQATSAWHDPATPTPGTPIRFEALVVQQHRANFDLWHEEDAARDPHASDDAIVRCKRAIDRINQLRNDLAEQLDQALEGEAGTQQADAPLHSESPGLIVDRLSILALKLFHTAEQVHRPGTTEAHSLRNRERLRILQAQRADLVACLDCLWAEVLAGKRRFKLYRQLKMYNDPTLNPVLYGSSQGA